MTKNIIIMTGAVIVSVFVLSAPLIDWKSKLTWSMVNPYILIIVLSMVYNITISSFIGIVIDECDFFPYLSAKENLQEIAKIKKTATLEDINKSLEIVGLDAVSKKAYKKFSLGMKKKLSLAQAIMEKPKVLLLDEPFNAIDKESIVGIKDYLKGYAKEKGAIILITSHHEDDLEGLADQVINLEVTLHS